MILNMCAGLFILAMLALLRWSMHDPWEYGTFRGDDTPARRHKRHGNVQFLLWRAGEHGHEADFWYDTDPSWWHTFEREDAHEVRQIGK